METELRSCPGVVVFPSQVQTHCLWLVFKFAKSQHTLREDAYELVPLCPLLYSDVCRDLVPFEILASNPSFRANFDLASQTRQLLKLLVFAPQSFPGGDQEWELLLNRIRDNINIGVSEPLDPAPFPVGSSRV